MYAGGKFHSVQNPRRTTTMVRDNLFSFDVSTGQPTGWSPQVNGEVWRTFYVAPYLYVGGDFTAADGVQERLVRYDVASGTPTIDTSWNPQGIARRVNDLDYVNGRLIVAGAFTKRLVALNPETGADTHYIDLPITGASLEVNAPDRSRFRDRNPRERCWWRSATSPPSTANRPRAFMLTWADVRHPRPWYYQPLDKKCRANSLPSYLATSTSPPTVVTSCSLPPGTSPSRAASVWLCATPRLGSRPTSPIRPGRPGSTTPAGTPCTPWR